MIALLFKSLIFTPFYNFIAVNTVHLFLTLSVLHRIQLPWATFSQLLKNTACPTGLQSTQSGTTLSYLQRIHICIPYFSYFCTRFLDTSLIFWQS